MTTEEIRTIKTNIDKLDTRKASRDEAMKKGDIAKSALIQQQAYLFIKKRIMSAQSHYDTEIETVWIQERRRLLDEWDRLMSVRPKKTHETRKEETDGKDEEE